MNNEKNPLTNENKPEVEKNTAEVKESVTSAAKKLPLGALIGIICGAVAVVVAVVLIILLSGNNEPLDNNQGNTPEEGNKPPACVAHVDADDDMLCDKCGVSYDDGEDVIQQVKNANVTITVRYDNGEPVADFTFTLYNNWNSYELTTNESGVVNATLALGTGATTPYGISYSVDELSLYCRIDAKGFNVTEETESLEITVVDDTPDGSLEKPLPIENDETEITLAPGQELYYHCRVAITTYITVQSSNVTISYKDTLYQAVDGQVQAIFAPSEDDEDNPINTNDMEVFSVKNISDEEITVTMVRSFILGSNENPEVLTEYQGSAQVKKGETYYYVWTADKDGVIVLSSPTENGSIKVTRIFEKIVYSEILGDYETIPVPIIAEMVAENTYVLYVKAGEEIKIDVSYVMPMDDTVTEGSTTPDTDDGSLHTVEFSFDVYAGNEQEPVPVEMSNISLTVDKGVSLVFTAEQGKSVTVSCDNRVSVTYGGAQLPAGDDGNVLVELTDSGVFEITIPEDSDTYKVIISLN